MRKDDQKLLENLIADAGRVTCPGTNLAPPRKKRWFQAAGRESGE